MKSSLLSRPGGVPRARAACAQPMTSVCDVSAMIIVTAFDFGCSSIVGISAQCGGRITSSDGVEKITHRLAGTHADDRRHRRFIDGAAAREARRLVQLDLELREVRPDGFLKQLHRAFGDRRCEVMLDVVRDPFRNARAAQRLEFERGRAREQPLVRL